MFHTICNWVCYFYVWHATIRRVFYSVVLRRCVSLGDTKFCHLCNHRKGCKSAFSRVGITIGWIAPAVLGLLIRSPKFHLLPVLAKLCGAELSCCYEPFPFSDTSAMRNPWIQVIQSAVSRMFVVSNSPRLDLVLRVIKRQEPFFNEAFGSDASIQEPNERVTR